MKIKTIVLTMCMVIMAIYNVNAQTQTGYKVPNGFDSGWNARVTQQENKQPSGTTSTFVTRYGTVGVNGSTTAGYMIGTDSAFPRSVWTPSTGKLNFIDIALQMAGSDIPSAGSLSTKLDAVSGVGTTNTFNSATLAGLGTITASFGANGLVITPAEYSAVDNATGELQGQINGKQASLGYSPLGNNVGSVTAALGSQAANALLDVNINMGNVGDFVKIGTGGVLVAGSSSVTTSFPEVTGSATSAQLPSNPTVPGTVTAGGFSGIGAGLTGYLNVVSAVKTAVETIATTGSWVDITGLSSNISLVGTSSKVLIWATVSGANNTNQAEVRVIRNNSIATGFVGDTAGSRISATMGGYYNLASGSVIQSHSACLVDSPGSTTASYKLQLYQAAGTTYINQSVTDSDTTDYTRSISSLVLVEIK